METKDQNTAEVFEQIYQNAQLLFEGGLYSEAADEFARIPDYKDAEEKKAECEEKKITSKLDEIYMEADKAAANMNVRSQEKAIKIFEQIPGYRDADERIRQAKRNIEEITAKEKTDREEAIAAAEVEKEKAKKRKKRIIKIVAAVLLTAAACVAGVFLFKKYAVPAIKYNRGVKLMEAGDYDEAYRVLHGLNYGDSNELVIRIAKERLKTAEIGSTVLFGAYPQGRITSEEKDPIEWIVLNRVGNKLLLISKQALDALPYMRYDYYQDNTPVTWETCLVREWLNSTFLNKAFDGGEERMLVKQRVSESDGGLRIVEDKVFLLSMYEVRRYLPTREDRKCTATKYATGFGAYRSSKDYTCLWWLRTPAIETTESVMMDDQNATMVRVSCVGTSGQIVDVGHDVLNCYAVRPVIWVDTEASGD